MKSRIASLPKLSYSVGEAVWFFDRSLAWLHNGLQHGWFVRPDGTTVTGNIDNPWHKRMLSLDDIRDIALSAYQYRSLTDEELVNSLAKILRVTRT